MATAPQTFESILNSAFETLLMLADGMTHDNPDCPEDETCCCENIGNVNRACRLLKSLIANGPVETLFCACQKAQSEFWLLSRSLAPFNPDGAKFFEKVADDMTKAIAEFNYFVNSLN